MFPLQKSAGLPRQLQLNIPKQCMIRQVKKKPYIMSLDKAKQQEGKSSSYKTQSQRHIRSHCYKSSTTTKLIIITYRGILIQQHGCSVKGLNPKTFQTCKIRRELHTFNPSGCNIETFSTHLESQTMKAKVFCRRKQSYSTVKLN